ncbi:MAG: hypothetical protein Q7R72_02870, partial [bacterium]|nr:hypothetical protein [bacterium]
NNIGQKDWIKVAEKKNLLVVRGTHGSHYINIRDPKLPDPKDVKGLITTITPNCFKQANEEIFKKFLKYGISEDEIWIALGFNK